MIETKPAVSITEMAKMVGLSYQRFSQLRRDGVFPEPCCDDETGRRFYNEERQEVCLLVRQRNTGINGRTILFYSCRTSSPSSTTRTKPKQPRKTNKYDNILAGIKSLGMSDVTADQVEKAVQETYPSGIEGADEADLIRTIFVHLMQKNCDS